MNSWEKSIDELIAQYHFIFNSNGDLRLSCHADKEFIHCYGLDEIEICVYCSMQSAGADSVLKWEIKKSKDKYYFFPVANKDFKDALQKIAETYPKCNEKGALYLENKQLIPLYKVCQGELCDTSLVKSCNIVVDMIFNLNQSNRTKEDLDNFCALFCCYNINFLHAFLLEIGHYIKGKDKEIRLKILEEVVGFMERVFDFRNYITNNPEAKAEYMESLGQTSMFLANLFRQRTQNDALPLNQYRNVAYDSKIKGQFPLTRKSWNYKVKIGSQGSCQTLFRYIAVYCTGKQLTFNGTKDDDDLQTVKTFLKTGDPKR